MPIPVFINNRNRLTTLRNLIDWLVAAHSTDITVIDNDSSYPPLLDYYRALPLGVKLHRNEYNLGPWCFWDSSGAYGSRPDLMPPSRLCDMKTERYLSLHLAQNLPYIYADSDCVPIGDCPKDLVSRLLSLLMKYPTSGKVGAGLRIDNLPDSFKGKSDVINWETHVIPGNHLEVGAERKAVDTTFAIYPPYGKQACSADNIRTTYPYVVEHGPWYVDSSNLSEEEKYYNAHTYPWWSDK